jgi:hypothetical protein
LYSKIDKEGRCYILMNSLIYHKKDIQATLKDDEFVVIHAKHIRRITNNGWKLFIQWKYGRSDWEILNRLKESSPVGVVEYAVANKISSEP